MNWEAWQLWLAAAMGLTILEVFVPGFVLACLGVGALAGALAAGLGLGLTAQLLGAAVGSLLAFLVFRPLMLKTSREDATRTGVDALIGRQCTVTLAFDEETGFGRCKVDGDDWRAELAEGAYADEAILNSTMWIDSVESNTLIVHNKPPLS
jgi:membrane protein implicated in regulation of membrane protease activity